MPLSLARARSLLAEETIMKLKAENEDYEKSGAQRE